MTDEQLAAGASRTLAVTMDELLAAATGRAIMCTLDDGTPCRLRLFTPEEWLREQHAVVDRLRQRVPNAGAKITMAQAEAQVAPLGTRTL